MPSDIFCLRDGHRTFFKWHRGRRTITDPVFTGQRIIEGMRLGASVEVDLVRHASNGFAVLHDETLDRETTGHGPVAEASADVIRQLRLRDNDGQPTAHPVMILEDLTALLAKGGLHPDALLQLDFKQTLADLTPDNLAGFTQAVAPVQEHMILSSGDAEAVDALARALPRLHVGYDPCHDGKLEELMESKDFADFVESALEDSPRAEMIYLNYALVLFADDNGFDIVKAFHDGGRRIDAYTIQSAGEESADTVERLLDLKVDQITTDDPAGLGRLITKIDADEAEI